MIVDDHREARSTMANVVAAAFDNPDISQAATLEQAEELVGRVEPEPIVLDLDLPDGRGEDLIPSILKQFPAAYVVVATIHDGSARLFEALQNGAKGYLLSDRKKHYRTKETFKDPIYKAQSDVT